MHWIEKWLTTFRMVSTSSITMQNLGKIVLRALAVCTKIWSLFFSVFFSVCHASVCQRAVRSRGHSLNKYCVMVYRSIFIVFNVFFQNGLFFHMD